jgi:predicted component of type VI protein secretion system
VLTDTHAKRFLLQDGRNTVGRGHDNDIALDADFRNVSRRHMIIEPEDEFAILLTDLSSHGTYVPPENIESS